MKKMLWYRPNYRRECGGTCNKLLKVGDKFSTTGQAKRKISSKKVEVRFFIHFHHVFSMPNGIFGMILPKKNLHFI